MTNKLLYTIPIPSDSQLEDSDQLGANLAESGLLEGGGAVVESISQQAGDKRLEGQYRGRYADLMASELEELAESGAIDTVPLFGRDESTPTDGYYAIESVDVGPLAPQTNRAQRFTLRLTKKGTTNSYYRSIATSPVQVENEFGNSLEALVGVDAAATKQRWFDPETGERTSASPLETRSGEFADLTIYDPLEADIATDDPVLIYALDYSREGIADPVVYDTVGNSEKFDDTDVRQWMHVFDPSHDPVGTFVFDTGLLRLQFDEDAGDLSAQEWDSSTETWTDVAIAIGDGEEFALYDLDLTHIGDEQDEAQVEFVDSDGALFALDCVLTAGAERAQWIVPDGEDGPVPTALADALDPIASERIIDAQPARGLVARSEVRR